MKRPTRKRGRAVLNRPPRTAMSNFMIIDDPACPKAGEESEEDKEIRLRLKVLLPARIKQGLYNK